jgi:hypothetical protein
LPPVRHGLHARGAARAAADPETALGHYRDLLTSWAPGSLGEELEWLGGRGANDLAPRLVRAWLDTDPTRREPEVLRGIASAPGWRSWEQQATVSLLNDLPEQLLAATPPLRFWQVEAWLRGVEPPDKVRLATASLVCLRDGWTPAPESLRRVCQLLFDELPEPDALAALVSSGLNRAALHDTAADVFRLESPAALLRWLSWLPVDRLASFPERALGLLQLGRDMVTGKRLAGEVALRGRLLDALRALRDAAAGAGCSPEEVHRLWLAICQQCPGEAGRYLTDLARASAPAAWADETLEQALNDPDVDLRTLRRGLSGEPGWGPRRVAVVLKLVGLLERLESVSTIAASPFVEAEHFAAVRRVFCPERDEENADMAVELLRHLRVSLNPRWLTPVKDLIQTLVAARRFDEAYLLSDEALAGPANGALDIRGVPVEVYLKERYTGASRTPPPESADYQRGIASVTRSWVCHRRGRRG